MQDWTYCLLLKFNLNDSSFIYRYFIIFVEPKKNKRETFQFGTAQNLSFSFDLNRMFAHTHTPDGVCDFNWCKKLFIFFRRHFLFSFFKTPAKIRNWTRPDLVLDLLKKEEKQKKKNLLLQFIFQWDTDSMYKYVCNVGNEMIDYRENVRVKIKTRKWERIFFFVLKRKKWKAKREILIANKFILKCNLY